MRKVFTWEDTARDWQNIFAMFINPYPSQRNCCGKFLCFFFCYSLMHHENRLEIFPYGALPSPLENLANWPSPSPLENPIPSVGLVWIFSGTTHSVRQATEKHKKTILSFPENIHENLVSLPTCTSFWMISWFSKHFTHWNEPNKCPAKENLVGWRRAKEVGRREIQVLSMHAGTSKTDFVTRTAFQSISSRGSCRPSEGSPRPCADFFCYI